ncbi:tRNA (N6-threonylcarbamoyladenosine(37)-N6)-methyltransferase TrmO [Ferrimonas lipolytica]|uniref:tRNA (N6-threonylcarbamoyladenosine(37)-N6)-methyltransferase TrmO n=1 Tax=Ferrimonas lipolytica TaxID=2724191 RepID=A0A6H1UEA5_9GAMM|nr:tRNA (N6-threonylcarbamoyladenosine(37)-N6)-methyltransferase TrmO [Ferrimonas lipolytica]QIZ77374.1 tRNA (N6-threonylcarbamoyladenosine(37)-N6)-methyltransferase TrmO [Ferrimonas lipolytica]
MSHSIEPVALCQSPYKQKFAIPRQPNLVPAAIGRLLLQGDCNRDECVRGLEQFSHLWLIWSFHQNLEQGWKPMVRPPRLGGNARVGVFASRATFRPNGLAMSVVKLHRVLKEGKQHIVEISGLDLLDGTPIFDIKPYVPYSDAVPDAIGGYASDAPTPMPMRVLDAAEQQWQQAQQRYPEFAQLAEQVLAQDPRPAYQREAGREYGVQLHDLDLRWQVIDGCNCVTAVVSI